MGTNLGLFRILHPFSRLTYLILGAIQFNLRFHLVLIPHRSSD